MLNLKVFSTVAISLLVSVAAEAQGNMCSGVFNQTIQTVSERVDKSARVKDLDPLASGGSIFLREQALSSDKRVAAMEIIRLLSHTRGTHFSFKGFEGKETGQFTLGLKLENNYSAELLYSSDYRSGVRFVLDRVLLITPSGKADIAVKTASEIEGGIREKLNVDLSDYPGLNGNDFILNVPTTIEGPVINEIAALGPKLETLNKVELQGLSRMKSYTKMKAFVNWRYVATNAKKFFIRGPFKTLYQITLGTPLVFGVAIGLNHAFPEQVKDLRSQISPKNEIVQEAMPAPAQRELQRLVSEIEKNGTAEIDRKNYQSLVEYLETKTQQPQAN